ncbi:MULTISPECIES: amidase [unclassified Streptomyces]|uniref:amidase n=1 Tax=unclassified Streptomyces TaxID=2593676 RepID=UPI000DB9EFA3|nr:MULTISPECIES: amidase [unclassified Streptomyces]MYT73462.1 amidase [Streptomyces sp. SID8367]RAJ84993.1 amidase [Streptomyces sp. PsTaAH-137]
MNTPTALHALTALEQAAAVRAGDTSPQELVRHHLDRAEAYDERFGAFVTRTPDAALAEAAALREGPGAEHPSPLFGVPTAVKDLTDTAGVATTYGSKAFLSHVPSADAHSVTRLRAAGTISIGKTNTPEFGCCCYTDNDVRGPARNPWDPALSAGGSSGGSAVAVALGLVPVAHASDGGGSIRIPASICGLVGIKPSRGRVSSGPAGAEVTNLSVQGPLARSVRDAAALLDALAGPEPGDPHWAPPLPPGETFLGHAERPPGRLRIGRYATPADDGITVDPECVAAWEHAAKLLESLRHIVEDIPTPFGPEIGDHFVTAWGVQSLGHALDADREALLRPATRAWREYGRTLSGERFAAAITGMQRASRRAIRATAAYDVVLTPTLATLPRPVEYFDESGDPLVSLHRQTPFSAFTSPYNMTGQPAMNVPLYWTAEKGIPIGVSLVGRPADEATLIALGAQLEEALPWRDRYEQLLSPSAPTH